MCAYHFHCSDGERILVDVIGRAVSDHAKMRAAAADRADEVLMVYPESDAHLWFGTVQDGEGRQGEVCRFDELLALTSPSRRVWSALPYAAPGSSVHQA